MSSRTHGHKSKINEAVAGYPRPQLQRRQWMSLDGNWDFAIDESAGLMTPEDVQWKSSIMAPFAPETKASGISHPGYLQGCWYRRRVETPDVPVGHRLILHFGAVDYSARVWVNGSLAVEHEGGYTPFSADITDLLEPLNPQTIVVHASDDPADMHKPRGKQDWLPEPHSIWYFRTTGIWQTVWLEVVPQTRIGALRWTPSVTRWDIGLEAKIDGPMTPGMKLSMKLTARNSVLAQDEYAASSRRVRRQITLPDPGIGDGREFLLWWPHRPTLIEAEITLIDGQGNVLDTVTSYTAMREVSVLGDRFLLNGSSYQLQLVLNQGYWNESGLTAPSDQAYEQDVTLIKQLGFNGARMHQKIESPRFLYWADKLGLLVWEEMPSAYAFNHACIARLTRQWQEAIERDYSHPCIVAWVPFNESWGVPDLPRVEEQRHLVQAMYHLTKSLDCTRPVISNDGWEHMDSDIISIHDYERDPAKMGPRYSNEPEAVAGLLGNYRPAGRVLLLKGDDEQSKPIMLTEFGGIAFSRETDGTWGYSRARSPEEFGERYAALMAAVRNLPLLAGFCYTQFTDTYQEANGLVFMDRTPKFPIPDIAAATNGNAHNPAKPAKTRRNR